MRGLDISSLPSRGYFIGSIGITLQVLAGFWDIYSHRLVFKGSDPWWNPAHFTLYLGVIILLLGVLIGLREFPEPRTRLRAYLVGYKVAGLGVVLELLAGTWNEIQHNVFDLKDPPVSPPHALLTIGMAVASFGLVLGLSLDLNLLRELGSKSLRILMTRSSLILSFLSLWLVSSGGFIFVFGVYEDPSARLLMIFALSLITPLILIPAIMTGRRFGYASILGLLYGFVNWYFLVIYFKAPYYHPISFIGPITVDIAFLISRDVMGEEKASVLCGGVSGFLTSISYHPFGLALLGLNLPPSLDLPILLASLSGALGSFFAFRILTGMGSAIKKSIVPLS